MGEPPALLRSAAVGLFALAGFSLCFAQLFALACSCYKTRKPTRLRIGLCNQALWLIFMSWRLPTLPGLNLVPSAQRDFTALFGMGRGVSPALFPPFALQFLYFGRADIFRPTYKMLLYFRYIEYREISFRKA